MYLEHFKLQQMPFGLTPNTELYFNRYSHRHALNTLAVALHHNEGFIKIVGEVGTGKTILCRKLLSGLNDNFITAYIPNPYLSSSELKTVLAEEIGVPLDDHIPSHKLLSAIYIRLIKLAQAGKQVVMVIDEAQAMPRDTLEALRLLTNLETSKRKLLQVVLLGQPELDELLNRPDLRQLKQRIVFSERLQPFSIQEVKNYVEFRLGSAGRNKELFSNTALLLLAVASGGIARLVNILAHKSMLVAFGRGNNRITTLHVARAIVDTEESRWLGRLLAHRWTVCAAACASVIVSVGITGLFMGYLP